jgi:EAL domain-containing protein (putative c-di-GMP-specific phosphodiesterase class I)
LRRLASNGVRIALDDFGTGLFHSRGCTSSPWTC